MKCALGYSSSLSISIHWSNTIAKQIYYSNLFSQKHEIFEMYIKLLSRQHTCPKLSSRCLMIWCLNI